MKAPHVWVDFNGQNLSKRAPGLFCITLDFPGSLIDLSTQQVRLEENMTVNIYMEDIEFEATVFFDSYWGRWMAEYDPQKVYTVPWRNKDGYLLFLCFQCRQDLGRHFIEHGVRSPCPFCGFNALDLATPPANLREEE
jgi:hypothetical protein